MAIKHGCKKQKTIPILLGLFCITFIVISAFLILKGYKKPGSGGPKYVFLITLDTTRADYIDWSLQGNELSPNLARLGASGMIFQNAFSLIPITLPSHYSMFYSLPPHVLKVYNNGQKKEISHPSLVEILNRMGYRTGAVISLGTLAADWGLDKGFDQYIENFGDRAIWKKTAEEVNLDAIPLIRNFKGKDSFFWLHYSDPHAPYFPPSFRGGRFLLKINGQNTLSTESTERACVDIDMIIHPGTNSIECLTTFPSQIDSNNMVHIDYINFEGFSLKFNTSSEGVEIHLPDEWTKKEVKNRIDFNTRKTYSLIRVINNSETGLEGKLALSHRIIPTIPSMHYLYREEIKYMDDHIGKLFDFIESEGIYEESVFIIMGDHGEGLGEFNGHIGHIDYLYKNYTRVPLLVFGKGIPEFRLIGNPVSNLNIAPTVMHILGCKKPVYMRGESLLHSFKSKNLLLETYSPEAIRDSFAIIDYPYQLIYYPDRIGNEWEFYNLDAHPLSVKQSLDDIGIANRFGKMMKRIRPFAETMRSGNHPASRLSEKQRHMLKSLGYIR